MTIAASTFTDKSLKDIDELMITPIDFFGYILNGLKIKNLTQEILLGPAFKLLKGTRSNFAELEYGFEECYTVLSEKLDWENPEGGDYPFDLSKTLPLITRGKRQRVPFEYFLNNDLKYIQGGVSTMTYPTSTTKTKVMRKYGYGYLEEIVVRRADNVLYRFKEGIEERSKHMGVLLKLYAYDRMRYRVSTLERQHKSFMAFAKRHTIKRRLYILQTYLCSHFVKVNEEIWIGYLEEIVVEKSDNVLLQIQGRSQVIQKRVEDLQLRVESYQKKINVTKPNTTRPDLKKRHPYTPYKDPQGFIYVDDYKRNSLMRSDKLYKFSDGTLTILLSSLEDITKNIDMEYLSKRRWSTLEKKRAHFMIKDINKLLKERRMMRSLEKFVGDRLYRTKLILLQRSI
ncbi:hypothetical protein Tco_0992312 [Tanacetum coccineum]|uniref:Reverse transcriptase domain-containing protein n=1 Tax=Tanacetum coccineum TaxID=301880 RepID=A0ABQ5F2I2_9ASTR